MATALSAIGITLWSTIIGGYSVAYMAGLVPSNLDRKSRLVLGIILLSMNSMAVVLFFSLSQALAVCK